MRLRLIGFLTLSVFVASAAQGQTYPQHRDGFTTSFGIGVGSAGVTCSGCGSDRARAPALYLRLGGAYHPNLILGGEVDGWSKEVKNPGSTASITVVTINAIAQWYPQPAGGFFVDGGLGVGSMNVEIKVPSATTLSDKTTGFAYQVGTGYDLRLAKNFSLTPYATFFGTAGGKVESNNAKVDANVIQIGLGFTWH